MKWLPSSMISIASHKSSADYFTHKITNPWTTPIPILTPDWHTLLAAFPRYRHSTHIRPQTLSCLWVFIPPYLQEYHRLLNHSSNCHIYFCKFLLLPFPLQTVRNTHPHPIDNNFISSFPMPLRRQLLPNLKISFWWIEVSFSPSCFIMLAESCFSLVFPFFVFIKSNNFI